MRSYPMFYFYPAGEEQTHKMYDKDPDIAVYVYDRFDMQGLLRFIKENRVRVQPEKILETMMEDPEKEVDLVDDELFCVCLMSFLCVFINSLSLNGRQMCVKPIICRKICLFR